MGKVMAEVGVSMTRISGVWLTLRKDVRRWVQPTGYPPPQAETKMKRSPSASGSSVEVSPTTIMPYPWPGWTGLGS